MTVREWFRLQRAALWARGDFLAPDIDAVATAITRGENPVDWRRIGPFHWIESVESEQERQRVLELVRRDMDQALRRLFLYAKGIIE